MRPLLTNIDPRIALGLLGIDLQDAALSACFLTGLGNARMESQLLGQLEVLTYKVALDRRGGSGSGTAAGGCGRHGSLGADPRDQARRDVRNTWSEMHRCGLVKVDKGESRRSQESRGAGAAERSEPRPESS